MLGEGSTGDGVATALLLLCVGSDDSCRHTTLSAVKGENRISHELTQTLCPSILKNQRKTRCLLQAPASDHWVWLWAVNYLKIPFSLAERDKKGLIPYPNESSWQHDILAYGPAAMADTLSVRMPLWSNAKCTWIMMWLHYYELNCETWTAFVGLQQSNAHSQKPRYILMSSWPQQWCLGLSW